MSRRTRGIFIIEVVLAMALVGILMTLLLTATASQRSGGNVLAERRALLRLAERIVYDLEHGDVAASTYELDEREVRVTLRAEDGEPIGERAWVRVTVEREGRAVSLTALAPMQMVEASTEVQP